MPIARNKTDAYNISKVIIMIASRYGRSIAHVFTTLVICHNTPLNLIVKEGRNLLVLP